MLLQCFMSAAVIVGALLIDQNFATTADQHSSKAPGECPIYHNKWGEENKYVEDSIINRPEEKAYIRLVKVPSGKQVLIIHIDPVNPHAAILDGQSTSSADHKSLRHRVSQTAFTLMQRDGNGTILNGIPMFTNSIPTSNKNVQARIEYLEARIEISEDRNYEVWERAFMEAFLRPDLSEIKFQCGRIKCSFWIDRDFMECLLEFSERPYEDK